MKTVKNSNTRSQKSKCNKINIIKEIQMTEDEIEAGLTSEDATVREAFALRTDYTPTPEQIERGLTDENDQVREAFAKREDIIFNEEQIERGLKDECERVRAKFILQNKYQLHKLNSNVKAIKVMAL